MTPPSSRVKWLAFATLLTPGICQFSSQWSYLPLTNLPPHLSSLLLCSFPFLRFASLPFLVRLICLRSHPSHHPDFLSSGGQLCCSKGYRQTTDSSAERRSIRTKAAPPNLPSGIVNFSAVSRAPVKETVNPTNTNTYYAPIKVITGARYSSAVIRCASVHLHCVLGFVGAALWFLRCWSALLASFLYYLQLALLPATRTSKRCRWLTTTHHYSTYPVNISRAYRMGF